jgi:hypothetical protein
MIKNIEQTCNKNIKIKETKEMEKIERHKLNQITKERKELKTCS